MEVPIPTDIVFILILALDIWHVPSISQYYVCVGVVFGSNIAAVFAVNHDKDHLWCSNTLYGNPSGVGVTDTQAHDTVWS